MQSAIVGGIILVIVGCSVRAIVKARKKGIKCIGCEYSGSCHKTCGQHKATVHTVKEKKN